MEKRSAALAVLLLASVLLLTTARDETDNILLPSQGNGAGVGKKACCNACACTKSIPPQCQCRDILIGGCHRNCKTCICTRSRIPQCQCTDVKTYCDPPCKLDE